MIVDILSVGMSAQSASLWRGLEGAVTVAPRVKVSALVALVLRGAWGGFIAGDALSESGTKPLG